MQQEFYIDRARCALTIAQQYTQLRGRAHQSTPKTDYAARVLPLPRALLPAIDALFAALDTRAALATKRGTWHEHDLLFPGRSGRPMNPSSLLHMLKRAAQQLDLPADLTVHHLRHTAAKFYTDLGAPQVVRVALAGHSPKSVTDYYGTPDLETLRPWVEQVDALLRTAGASQRHAAA
jgi:integrase